MNLMLRTVFLPCACAVLLSAALAATEPVPTQVGGTFVRPPGAAPLFGMNIGGNKNYDDPVYQTALARLDIVVLGFYPGWRFDTGTTKMRQAVMSLRARNPALKVGQYTNGVNDAIADPAKTTNDDMIVKLDAMNWWLRDAVTGERKGWSTLYGAYDINFTTWSPADANGDRWPQWLAKRNFARYFGPVPEFDLWYVDALMKHSRVGHANWRWDGVNVSSQDPEVASTYRQGVIAHLATASSLAPGRLLMGNADNDLAYPEYKGQLPAAFLEAMMGKSWSIENRGWITMMQRYFDVASNLKAPGLVAFNAWGAVNDYRFFRYAFASCRLGNGHFAYTDSAVGYGSVPWFDEYEVAFGAAIDAPSLTPWQNGVHRRRFEKAMVLVNPNADPRTVNVGKGWRRLLASQDPVANDGTPARRLTLGPKEGIVLVMQ